MAASTSKSEIGQLLANKKAIKEFQDWWIAQGNSLNILVTGKTGAGKSTLVNALVGQKVAIEGRTHKPETKEVTEYETKLENGLEIKVWDSPGLQDGTSKEEEYLADMKAKCKDIHLLLYCISLQNERSDLDCDESAITKLTKAFGPEIWNNAVFVLTYANYLQNRLKIKSNPNGKELENQFEARISQWKEKIQGALRKVQVAENLISNINVVAAGHYRKPSLPGRPFWLSIIWHTCYHIMKEEAKPVMIKLSAHRLKAAKDVKDEDFQTASSTDVPIVVAESAGIAGIAAFAGASIGAVIGGVVIGAGTLGVGVGIGVAAGGAVGAGVGIAVSLLLGVDAWRNSKKKKETSNKT